MKARVRPASEKLEAFYRDALMAVAKIAREKYGDEPKVFHMIAGLSKAVGMMVCACFPNERDLARETAILNMDDAINRYAEASLHLWKSNERRSPQRSQQAMTHTEALRERLDAELYQYGNRTLSDFPILAREATRRKILELILPIIESEQARLREALKEIRDGHGPQHGSNYCRDIATRALHPDEKKEASCSSRHTGER